MIVVVRSPAIRVRLSDAWPQLKQGSLRSGGQTYEDLEGEPIFGIVTKVRQGLG